jgi:tetratricopeptide (TPR) repeat protein
MLTTKRTEVIQGKYGTWWKGALYLLLLMELNSGCNKTTMRKGAEDLYKQGRFRESAFHYQKLYRQHPSDAIAMQLASSYIKSGKHKEASDFVKSCLEKDHDLTDFALEYANLLRHAEEYDEAIVWYEKHAANDTTAQAGVATMVKWSQLRKEQQPSCYGSDVKKHCVQLDATESIDKENADLQFVWEFDDGKTEKGVTITHCFDEGGEHEVQLHVTDPKTKTTDVKELLVPIVFEPPLQVNRERNVYAQTATKFSLDVEELEEGHEVVWEFGDTEMAWGKEVEHRYYASGRYLLKVFLLDENQQIIKCNELAVSVFNKV